jgi:hypothetical protein
MTGYVYAIECDDLIKVGFSHSPVKRLKQLQTGSSKAYRLIGYARGTKVHEQELHTLAAAEGFRGEWFRKGRVISLFLEHLPKHDLRSDAPPNAFDPSGNITVRGAVAALGGTKVLSDQFGVTVNAVCNWTATGKFPPHTFVSISRELERLGLAAPMQLWGFTQPKQASAAP